MVRRVQVPLRREGAATTCGQSGRARELGNRVHGGGPHEPHVERPSLFWERWDRVWGLTRAWCGARGVDSALEGVSLPLNRWVMCLENPEISSLPEAWKLQNSVS